MRRTSLTLGRMVQLGLATLVGVMVLVNLASLVAQRRLVQNARAVAHHYTVEAYLAEIAEALLDVEVSERSYLYTGKVEFLEPYDDAKNALPGQFTAVRDLIKDPAQVERLRIVEDLAQQWLDSAAQAIASRKAGGGKGAVAALVKGKGMERTNEIRAKIADFRVVEDRFLEEDERAAAQARIISTTIAVGGTALAIVVGLVILMVISRRVIAPIRMIVNAVATASTQISAAVEEQERTASHQAAAVSETTATMHELGVSARQSAEQAESATGRSHQSITLAQEGGRVVQETLDAISTVRTKVVASAEQILRLSEQTNQIGIIATFVGDMASQTNLLALNAAVEAARAGEHGRGFAVVAAEIRKLADQSKKSAQRIDALVADIQKATNATVMATEEGSRTAESGMLLTQRQAEAFDNLTTAIGTTVEAVQQIALNAKQQAIAVNQVVEAMSSVNAGAKQTAAAAVQIKAGIHNLSDSAQDLQAIV